MDAVLKAKQKASGSRKPGSIRPGVRSSAAFVNDVKLTELVSSLKRPASCNASCSLLVIRCTMKLGPGNARRLLSSSSGLRTQTGRTADIIYVKGSRGCWCKLLSCILLAQGAARPQAPPIHALAVYQAVRNS